MARKAASNGFFHHLHCSPVPEAGWAPVGPGAAVWAVLTVMLGPGPGAVKMHATRAPPGVCVLR